MQCRKDIWEAGALIHPWFVNDKEHLQVVLLFVFPLLIFLAHCINSEPSSQFSQKMWLAYTPFFFFFLPPMTNSSVSTFNTWLEMSVLPLDVLGLHLPCFIVTNSDHKEDTTADPNQGFALIFLLSQGSPAVCLLCARCRYITCVIATVWTQELGKWAATNAINIC